MESLVFFKCSFDGETVGVKTIKSWKAGPEEEIEGVVKASHVEKRDEVICLVELDDPQGKGAKDFPPTPMALRSSAGVLGKHKDKSKLDRDTKFKNTVIPSAGKVQDHA
ncbi:hypothetical protein B9Z19DRAFT_1121946 [Tuber borchii]|uniref:Uncharacterized protein n=1 Tax=Tuber borchii TaxID=42251 RepID=A0A2T7A1N3_TUBBO|nr:hypothetical protein B9Z19DRAFT_1121946 [Tuber borchii]